MLLTQRMFAATKSLEKGWGGKGANPFTNVFDIRVCFEAEN